MSSATNHQSTGIETGESGLHRGLSAAQVSMIGLSGALGTGLFLGSGSMIGVAGPGAILSYAITGVLAFVVVWALAEMTVVHPVAGGFGAIAHAYLGPAGGWFLRWNVAIVMCIAVGAEVVATGSYLHWFWPGLSVGVGTVLASVLVVLVNLASVGLYGASEYWFSIVKVAMVVVFLVLGVVLVCFGLPHVPAIGLGNLTGGNGWHGFAPFGLTGILAGAVMAVFSFGGVENVSVAAAESEDPVRDVPRAARSMITRLVLFYVGAIAVVVVLQPWRVTAASGGGVRESPFVKVLGMVRVPAAAPIMNFVLVTAALSAAIGCLYASARVAHSLALDGLAPRVVAHTAADGVPRRAVLLAALGMVLASVLAVTSPDEAFQILYGILIFGLLTTWVLILATYLAFRTRRARLGLPGAGVRLWGGRVTAAVVLVVFLVIYPTLHFIEDLAFALPIGAGYVVLLGLAFLLVRRRVSSFGPSVLDEELADAHQAEGGDVAASR